MPTGELLSDLGRKSFYKRFLLLIEEFSGQEHQATDQKMRINEDAHKM
jgi:hypothetical protein